MDDWKVRQMETCFRETETVCKVSTPNLLVKISVKTFYCIFFIMCELNLWVSLMCSKADV